MSLSNSVIFTRAARDTNLPLPELRRAALAAAGEFAAPEIWFRTFTVRGRQFALSTRVVIDVDYFPHRVPAKVLLRRAPGK